MPHRILLAETEHAARSALDELLRDEGYRVTSASNGAEALAALEANGADLLLLDLVIAIADGGAILESIRSRHSGTPTILMTDFPPDEPRVANFLRAPAVETIHKPVDLGVLFDAVETALSGRPLFTGVASEQAREHIRGSLGEDLDLR